MGFNEAMMHGLGGIGDHEWLSTDPHSPILIAHSTVRAIAE